MSNFTIDFLKRCERITTKYENENNWSLQDQLLHIYEEVGEVQDAYRTGPMEHLKEEMCDVILATITMFHKLDVNPYEIQDAMEKTLQKVEKRLTKGAN
jgi:NTP pyrophosphatase (non-canonical NTP hydrolase)